MATWKKVIDDTDKLSNLSDVHANGSANGQTLLYDAGNSRYTPAVVTGGTYLTQTVGAGTLSIDMSNQDALDRLETLTGSEIVVGAISQNGNSNPMDLNGNPVRLNSSRLHGNNDANLEIQAYENKSMQLKVKKTGGSVVNAITLNAASERVEIGDSAQLVVDYNGSSPNITMTLPTTVSTYAFKPNGGLDSTAGSIDWLVKDNDDDALQIGSAGKTNLINIDTTNDEEEITINGGLVVTGDLEIQGNSTTLDTTILRVEDKLIMVANTTSPTVSTGDGGGIYVETNHANETNDPKLKWHKALGGGNTDGAGTAVGLTGWKVSNAQTSNQAEYTVAVMDFKTDTGAPSNNSAGVGAFSLNTNDDALYIRTA